MSVVFAEHHVNFELRIINYELPLVYVQENPNTLQRYCFFVRFARGVLNLWAITIDRKDKGDVISYALSARNLIKSNLLRYKSRFY